MIIIYSHLEKHVKSLAIGLLTTLLSTSAYADVDFSDNSTAASISVICNDAETILGMSTEQYGEILHIVAEAFLVTNADNLNTGGIAIMKNPINGSYSIFFIPDTAPEHACMLVGGQNLIVVDALGE